MCSRRVCNLPGVLASLLVIFLPAQVVPLDSAPPAKPRGLVKGFSFLRVPASARRFSHCCHILLWMTSKAW